MASRTEEPQAATMRKSIMDEIWQSVVTAHGRPFGILPPSEDWYDPLRAYRIKARDGSF